MMRRIGWVVVLASLLVLPGLAQAQVTSATLHSGGMDLHLFRPAIDSKGHLSVNGTDLLGHRDFSFGLVLDAGFGILPFRGFVDDSSVRPLDADRTDRIVSQAFTGTLHFNYGLFNRVVVGLQLPIVVMNGSAIEVPGEYNIDTRAPRGLAYQGIGAITIHAKARILRAERDPIGLAAILRVQLPTGDPGQFASDPGLALWPSLVAEYRPVRRARFSLELGYRLVIGDGTTFSVDGRTDPDPMNSSATGAVLTDPGTPLTYNDMLTFGFGMSFRVADSLDLVGEIYGSQIASEFGTSGALSLEALLGLKIFVQQNSYLTISGGMGIPVGGFQSADYRAVLGFIFEPSIGDRDGDGYKDDVDQCPDEPEDFDGFSDEDGCPDPDNDRDGILDVDDKCPNEPETYNGYQDEDGCPDKGRVVVHKGRIEILDKIYFETDKAIIKPVSYPILDAIGATLKGNPQILLIEIQGHADERGADSYNMRLTDDRAHAVMKYFTNKGVEGNRLKAKGYGETRPVDKNHNEEAWSKNRRVEFVILKRSE